MLVFVKSQDETFGLNVESFDKIEDVKSKIQKKIKIPAGQQRLVCKGRQLDDKKSLLDYKIEKEFTLQLFLSLKGGNEIEFVVKPMNGEGIRIKIDDKSKVSDVKKYIYRSNQIPVGQQIFSFTGQELQDQATLESYQVTNGSVVHLVLRLNTKSSCCVM